jgi:hypothetical protein
MAASSSKGSWSTPVSGRARCDRDDLGPHGSATVPEAAPGHLCVYENADRTNTSGIEENLTTTSGSTIFINADAAGVFYSYGSWAVTAH